MLTSQREGSEAPRGAQAAGVERLAPRKPFAVVAPSRGFGLRLGELWRYRDLLLTLCLRNIQIRYKQALLGGFWAILQPTIAALLFAVVFGRVIGVDTGSVPYLLFAYSGMLVWTFFAAMVSGAATSLLENAYLVTKVYFPRVLVPASVSGYALLDLSMGVPILAILMIYYGYRPGIGTPFALIVLFAIGLCALGAGILFSALTVKYRDVRFVVPFLLQVWMFASPVIYPVSAVPEAYRAVAAINPMFGLLHTARALVLEEPIDVRVSFISGVVAVLLLLLGLAIFRRVEDQFADVV